MWAKRMKTVKARSALVCVSIIIVGLMFTGQGFTKIDPEAVIGVWLLDEGKGDTARDFSGNGHDGKIHGNIKWVDGKFKNALEFDGQSTYIEVPHSEALNPPEFTICLWVKPYRLANSKLFGKGDIIGGGLGVSGYLLGMSDSGGVYPEVNDVSKSANFQFAQGSSPSDEWSHFALTYSMEDKTLIGYINGQEVGRTMHNGKPVATSEEPLIIGVAPWDKSSFPLEGVMDEIGFFSTPLKQEEIQDIMNKGLEEVVVPSVVLLSRKLATTWATIKAR